MINISSRELKAITKLRKVKDYKSKSEDELLKILSEPNIEKIRKKSNDLRDNFF